MSDKVRSGRETKKADPFWIEIPFGSMIPHMDLLQEPPNSQSVEIPPEAPPVNS